MATNHLRKEALSHAQQVCRFYKRAQRTLHGKHTGDVANWRYYAVLLRAEIEKNRDLPFEQAKQALENGEEILYLRDDPFPFKFWNSPKGVNYGRAPYHNDALLDCWHPYEKAQYPEYFAKRDIRKREFIERYNEKYGATRTQ